MKLETEVSYEMKMHKLIEIKQHTTQWWVGPWRNQEGNKKGFIIDYKWNSHNESFLILWRQPYEGSV